MPKLSKKIRETIAKKFQLIETLEVRGRDKLDFHEVGVANVELALQAAFEEGIKFAKKPVKEKPRPVIKGFVPVGPI